MSGTATPSWSEPSWSKLCEFSRHSQTDACRSRKTSSVSSPQFQRYGTFWPPTRDCFRGRASLQIEVIALRHQFHVLERSVKRPKLTASDRFFWACLAAIWRSWRSALIMVKPETVIGWHRKGFGWFWAWKIRYGKPGRPAVPKEVRAWIRTMSRENPLWGAPRIHGESKSSTPATKALGELAAPYPGKPGA